MIELANQAGYKLWSPQPGTPTQLLPNQPLQSNWWHPPNPGARCPEKADRHPATRPRTSPPPSSPGKDPDLYK
jgi:hypothetical protein